MVDGTEQKILDAALKIFAEKGYKGATIRGIAAEAGVNSSTVFRNFKTKKNIYRSVLIQNDEKMMKEFGSVLMDKKFESPRDFLENYVKSIAKISWDNYDFIFMSLTQKSPLIEPMLSEFTDFLETYIEENIKNEKINYRTFGLNIMFFIFMINFMRYFGRNIVDYDIAIEEFIDNILMCIE